MIRFLMLLVMLVVTGCQSLPQQTADAAAVSTAFTGIDTSDALTRIVVIEFDEQDLDPVYEQIDIIEQQDKRLRQLISDRTISQIAVSRIELRNIVYSLRDAVSALKDLVNPYYPVLDAGNQVVLSAYYQKAEAAYRAYERIRMRQDTLAAVVEVIHLAKSIGASG